jgi:hypothetical protein
MDGTKTECKPINEGCKKISYSSETGSVYLGWCLNGVCRVCNPRCQSDETCSTGVMCKKFGVPTPAVR